MRSRSLPGRWKAPSAVALCLSLGLVAAVAAPAVAAAAPALRFQTDVHGDMVVFGNTLGFDCRTGVPDPVVGNVDRTQCYEVTSLNLPLFIDDTSADVFWRAEDSGQVSATATIQMDQARSAAVLQIPSGSTVAYARIYWGSTVREDTTNASTIMIDRPGSGGFSRAVTAATSDIQAADRSFQATADVTGLVQSFGAGVYRVSGFPKSQLVDRSDDNNYAAWAMVVIYKRDTDPIRNIAIYDGLTYISPNNNSSLTVRGFAVPPSGALDSKLTVIGYEGDHDAMGDSLLFKGNRLTDGQPGSDMNLFNSSRTSIGQTVAVDGDLPKMSGAQASMNGIDIDTISITQYLTSSDTQAQIDLVTGTTLGSDAYFVGMIATSIGSHKPIIDSTLTVPQGVSPLPGDTVEYTLTLRNVGDDTGSDVVVQHALPAGLVYVPGSLRVVGGPSQGAKTDKAGDDEAEFDQATSTLIIRIGTGATASMGGTIKAGDAAVVVKYQLRVADTAFGDVATQAITRATPAAQPAAGPSYYPSSDGTLPNHPTVISVRACQTNYDCTVTAPACDLHATPHRCTASCTADADCQGGPGGKDVCGSGTCVQCSTAAHSACTADGLGLACLPTGACGCTSDADCGGRKCNTATNTCPNPSVDLSVSMATSGDIVDADHPVNLVVTVSNAGPAIATSGTLLVVQIQQGGTVQSVDANQGWRCTLTDGAVRCVYYRPLAPGASAPAIHLVVSPASGSAAGSLSAQASVSSDTSTDVNPGNNTVTQTFDLGSYRVAGGGFGCSLTPDGRSASLWSAVAIALSLLLSLRRRRALDEAGGAGRTAGQR